MRAPENATFRVQYQKLATRKQTEWQELTEIHVRMKDATDIVRSREMVPLT
jgi:hypothetical protein